MPWVNPALCTGCSICVADCPVDAIALNENNVAEIVDAECIRCGRCHDACPQEAVRHDSERIPQEVADNLRWVLNLLAHYEQPDERAAFVKRMVRFFKKQRKVSDQTLAVLDTAGDAPADSLETAIRELAESGNATAVKG